MQSPDKKYRKRIYVVCACTVIALTLATTANVRGILPARGLGPVVLLIWATAATAFLLTIRSLRQEVRKQREVLGPKSPEFAAITNERLTRFARSLKQMIALFSIALVAILWMTRDKPFVPRAVGAAFALLIIGYFGWILFKLNKSTAKNSSSAQDTSSASPD
jgi:hypothetical protein